MSHERPISEEVDRRKNGKGLYFLLVPCSIDPEQHEIFGPYTKDFVDNLYEEFGGMIIQEEIDLEDE